MISKGPLIVYAENVRGRDPIYELRENDIRTVLSAADKNARITVRYSDDPDRSALNEAEVFVGSRFDTKFLSQSGFKLKLIHATSAGVEAYMPLDWLPPGATLTNSSGIQADKVGEFGLLALLMLNDQIPRHMTSQRNHEWRQAFSTPIRGKTVLIVGVGSLGEAVAEKARLLGMRVTGIRRNGASHPHVDQMYKPDALHAALADCDFLVLSCPLTEHTRGMIGAPEIARMKTGAGLINISRAGVVDHSAICAALRSEKLSGAILDVFDPEPLPASSPLWDEPNLVVIPHVSSDTPVGYIQKSLQILGRNVTNLREGRPIENAVNAEFGY